MIRKRIAIVMVTLATSPLTAPFQTFYAGNIGTGASAATIVFTFEAGTSLETNPGSLVPPLRTQPGRVSVAPDLGLNVTPSITFSPIVFLAPLIDTPGSPPVFQAPLSRIILRI